MACPTCSHTMDSLSPGRWWCSRCGTLKSVTGHLGTEYETVVMPKLVGRVREFVRMINDTTAGRFLRQQAEVSGVLESTLPPDARPADPFPGTPVPVAPPAAPVRAVPITRDPTPGES